MLGFQYVFASDEYPEWIGPFNDPMAIFVTTNRTATNWINTNNIALVPGTSLAVSVNTINGGCAISSNGGQIPPTNPQYYVDNCDPNYSAVPLYAEAAPAFNIQYDGMTVLLTAQAQIAANVTNHVKIAIADFSDDQYDSAVFLEDLDAESVRRHARGRESVLAPTTGKGESPELIEMSGANAGAFRLSQPAPPGKTGWYR